MRALSFFAVGLLSVAMYATPANNAEQVIFSATGATTTLGGNARANATPFGFWIWRAAQAPAGSNSG